MGTCHKNSRRNRVSLLVYPGKSFSKLFVLWFKLLTVSLSNPALGVKRVFETRVSLSLF